MKDNEMAAQERMTLLVLGATGMLGNAVFRFFAMRDHHTVLGTARTKASAALLPANLQARVLTDIDVESQDCLTGLFAQVRPDAVINCIGLVKQLAEAAEPLSAIPTNSLLPHRLARLCELAGARLVHISTDCVFSGRKGLYIEDDPPDAEDLYGRSKLLGEVDYPHAITLRTSIIGHELRGAHGLIDWFLSQQGSVRGYKKAIFSGLPTVELARVMHDFVLPTRGLHGLYHVSAGPIDKDALLRLVAAAYGNTTVITPDEKVVIDRSLDSSRFRSATGYVAPAWPALIDQMRAFG
jgi:dTDP-4-dehydrorhamnose reductase